MSIVTVGEIVGRLRLDTSPFHRSLMEANHGLLSAQIAWQRSFASLSSAVGGAATAIGAIGVVATLQLKEMAMAFANATESENLFEVSLNHVSGAAEELRGWSESLRESLGLNDYEIRKNIGTIFVMVDSMGIASSTAKTMAKDLTLLAYDMASFYNISNEDAFYKLQAGITGIITPLKRLGIDVMDVTVKNYAMAHGFEGSWKAADQATKAFFRYKVIMEQTYKAQGDLARTMHTPINQIRLMQEEWEILKIEMGERFMPMLGLVVSGLKGLVAITARLNPMLLMWVAVGAVATAGFVKLGLALQMVTFQLAGMIAGMVASAAAEDKATQAAVRNSAAEMARAELAALRLAATTLANQVELQAIQAQLAMGPALNAMAQQRLLDREAELALILNLNAAEYELSQARLAAAAASEAEAAAERAKFVAAAKPTTMGGAALQVMSRGMQVMTGPWVTIPLLLVGITAALIKLYQTNKGFKDSFDSAAKEVRAATGEMRKAFAEVKDDVAAAAMAIGAALAAVFSPVVVSAIQNTAKAIEWVANAMQGMAQDETNSAMTAFGHAILAVAAAALLLNKYIFPLITGIGGLITRIGTFAGGLAALGPAGAAAGTALAGLGAAITGLLAIPGVGAVLLALGSAAMLVGMGVAKVNAEKARGIEIDKKTSEMIKQGSKDRRLMLEDTLRYLGMSVQEAEAKAVQAGAAASTKYVNKEMGKRAQDTKTLKFVLKMEGAESLGDMLMTQNVEKLGKYIDNLTKVRDEIEAKIAATMDKKQQEKIKKDENYENLVSEIDKLEQRRTAILEAREEAERVRAERRRNIEKIRAEYAEDALALTLQEEQISQRIAQADSRVEAEKLKGQKQLLSADVELKMAILTHEEKLYQAVKDLDEKADKKKIEGIKHQYALERIELEGKHSRAKSVIQFEIELNEKAFQRRVELEEFLHARKLELAEQENALTNDLRVRALDREASLREALRARSPEDREKTGTGLTLLDLETKKLLAISAVDRYYGERIKRLTEVFKNPVDGERMSEEVFEKRKGEIESEHRLRLSTVTAGHDVMMKRIQLESGERLRQMRLQREYFNEALTLQRSLEDLRESSAQRQEASQRKRDHTAASLQRELLGETWGAYAAAQQAARDADADYRREVSTSTREMQRAVQDAYREFSDGRIESHEALQQRLRGIAASFRGQLEQATSSLTDKTYDVKVQIQRASLQSWKENIKRMLDMSMFDNPDFRRGVTEGIEQFGKYLDVAMQDMDAGQRQRIMDMLRSQESAKKSLSEPFTLAGSELTSALIDPELLRAAGVDIAKSISGPTDAIRDVVTEAFTKLSDYSESSLQLVVDKMAQIKDIAVSMIAEFKDDPVFSTPKASATLGALTAGERGQEILLETKVVGDDTARAKNEAISKETAAVTRGVANLSVSLANIFGKTTVVNGFNLMRDAINGAGNAIDKLAQKGVKLADVDVAAWAGKTVEQFKALDPAEQKVLRYKSLLAQLGATNKLLTGDTESTINKLGGHLGSIVEILSSAAIKQADAAALPAAAAGSAGQAAAAATQQSITAAQSADLLRSATGEATARVTALATALQGAMAGLQGSTVAMGALVAASGEKLAILGPLGAAIDALTGRLRAQHEMTTAKADAVAKLIALLQQQRAIEEEMARGAASYTGRIADGAAAGAARSATIVGTVAKTIISLLGEAGESARALVQRGLSASTISANLVGAALTASAVNGKAAMDEAGAAADNYNAALSRAAAVSDAATAATERSSDATDRGAMRLAVSADSLRSFNTDALVSTTVAQGLSTALLDATRALDALWLASSRVADDQRDARTLDTLARSAKALGGHLLDAVAPSVELALTLDTLAASAERVLAFLTQATGADALLATLLTLRDAIADAATVVINAVTAITALEAPLIDSAARARDAASAWQSFGSAVDGSTQSLARFAVAQQPGGSGAAPATPPVSEGVPPVYGPTLPFSTKLSALGVVTRGAVSFTDAAQRPEAVGSPLAALAPTSAALAADTSPLTVPTPTAGLLGAPMPFSLVGYGFGAALPNPIATPAVETTPDASSGASAAATPSFAEQVITPVPGPYKQLTDAIITGAKDALAESAGRVIERATGEAPRRTTAQQYPPAPGTYPGAPPIPVAARAVGEDLSTRARETVVIPAQRAGSAAVTRVTDTAASIGDAATSAGDAAVRGAQQSVTAVARAAAQAGRATQSAADAVDRASREAGRAAITQVVAGAATIADTATRAGESVGRGAQRGVTLLVRTADQVGDASRATLNATIIASRIAVSAAKASVASAADAIADAAVGAGDAARRAVAQGMSHLARTAGQVGDASRVALTATVAATRNAATAVAATATRAAQAVVNTATQAWTGTVRGVQQGAAAAGRAISTGAQRTMDAATATAERGQAYVTAIPGRVARTAGMIGDRTSTFAADVRARAADGIATGARALAEGGRTATAMGRAAYQDLRGAARVAGQQLAETSSAMARTTAQAWTGAVRGLQQGAANVARTGAEVGQAAVTTAQRTAGAIKDAAGRGQAFVATIPGRVVRTADAIGDRATTVATDVRNRASAGIAAGARTLTGFGANVVVTGREAYAEMRDAARAAGQQLSTASTALASTIAATASRAAEAVKIAATRGQQFVIAAPGRVARAAEQVGERTADAANRGVQALTSAGQSAAARGREVYASVRADVTAAVGEAARQVSRGAGAISQAATTTGTAAVRGTITAGRAAQRAVTAGLSAASRMGTQARDVVVETADDVRDAVVGTVRAAPQTIATAQRAIQRSATRGVIAAVGMAARNYLAVVNTAERITTGVQRTIDDANAAVSATRDDLVATSRAFGQEAVATTRALGTAAHRGLTATASALRATGARAARTMAAVPARIAAQGSALADAGARALLPVAQEIWHGSHADRGTIYRPTEAQRNSPLARAGRTIARTATTAADSVRGAITGVRTTAKRTGEGVVDTAARVGDAVTNAATRTVDRATDTADRIGDTVTNAMQTAPATMANAGRTIARTATKVASTAGASVRRAATGVTTAARRTADTAADTAVAVGTTAADTLRAAPATMANAGRAIARTATGAATAVETGVRRAAAGVATTARRVADGTVDTTTRATGTVADALQAVPALTARAGRNIVRAVSAIGERNDDTRPQMTIGARPVSAWEQLSRPLVRLLAPPDNAVTRPTITPLPFGPYRPAAIPIPPQAITPTVETRNESVDTAQDTAPAPQMGAPAYPVRFVAPVAPKTARPQMTIGAAPATTGARPQMTIGARPVSALTQIARPLLQALAPRANTITRVSTTPIPVRDEPAKVQYADADGQIIHRETYASRAEAQRAITANRALLGVEGRVQPTRAELAAQRRTAEGASTRARRQEAVLTVAMGEPLRTGAQTLGRAAVELGRRGGQWVERSLATLMTPKDDRGTDAGKPSPLFAPLRAKSVAKQTAGAEAKAQDTANAMALIEMFGALDPTLPAASPEPGLLVKAFTRAGVYVPEKSHRVADEQAAQKVVGAVEGQGMIARVVPYQAPARPRRAPARTAQPQTMTSELMDYAGQLRAIRSSGKTLDGKTALPEIAAAVRRIVGSSPDVTAAHAAHFQRYLAWRKLSLTDLGVPQAPAATVTPAEGTPAASVSPATPMTPGAEPVATPATQSAPESAPVSSPRTAQTVDGRTVLSSAPPPASPAPTATPAPTPTPAVARTTPARAAAPKLTADEARAQAERIDARNDFAALERRALYGEQAAELLPGGQFVLSSGPAPVKAAAPQPEVTADDAVTVTTPAPTPAVTQKAPPALNAFLQSLPGTKLSPGLADFKMVTRPRTRGPVSPFADLPAALQAQITAGRPIDPGFEITPPATPSIDPAFTITPSGPVRTIDPGFDRSPVSPRLYLPENKGGRITTPRLPNFGRPSGEISIKQVPAAPVAGPGVTPLAGASTTPIFDFFRGLGTPGATAMEQTLSAPRFSAPTPAVVQGEAGAPSKGEMKITVGTEDGLRAIITRVAGEVILESQRQAKMNLSSGFNANA